MSRQHPHPQYARVAGTYLGSISLLDFAELFFAFNQTYQFVLGLSQLVYELATDLKGRFVAQVRLLHSRYVVYIG